MTPKYWAGIVAVMLAIFGVGMLVARGVHQGKMFVENNFPSSLGLINADFHVDGDRVGDIKRLQFMRSTPGRVDSAVVTVKLTGDADALEEPACVLRVVNAQPFGSSTRFLCTSARDSARLHLVRFGHIELSDGNQVVLYVSGDRADDVQQHAYRGTGADDSGDVDISAADGALSITVNGKEIVHASGDSNGGSLVIRDANGRPIVQISGDSAGGSIKVTDADGKTRVNIHGAGVNVHSSSSKKDSTKDN